MNINKFTQKSIQAVNDLEKTAYEYGNQELEQEHLLMSLLRQEDSLILKLISKMEIQTEHFVNRVDQALNKRVKVSGGQPYVGQYLNKVLISAEDEAKQMGDEYVSVEHLFLALLDNPSPSVKEIFKEYGITRERFLKALSTVRGNQRVTSDNPEATYDTLNKYGADLVERAREQKLDPVIGRDAEIRNIIRILSRKTKNNPVLIGEPGVGKTAAIEGLAQRIVRGDVQEDGSWKWTSVVGDKENDGAKYTFGIDPERTRSGAANLISFGGYLYIGEYNDEEIAVERMLFDNDFTFMNLNFEQPVNFYRMDEDENVELIVGDEDEMFPEGGLSGMGSGFGCNENQYIWKMVEYDGKLYVGTYDASSFLLPLDEYMNDENADQDWKDKVDGYVEKLCSDYQGVPESAVTCGEYLDKAIFGFDLYVTEDGIHFTKITDDGFGDPYNHGCRAFGITDEGLFVGTANPFYGTQVWRLSENADLEKTDGGDEIQDDVDAVNDSDKTDRGNIGILVGVLIAAAVFLLAVYRKKKQK